jgi:hypothetical protein
VIAHGTRGGKAGRQGGQKQVSGQPPGTHVPSYRTQIRSTGIWMDICMYRLFNSTCMGLPIRSTHATMGKPALSPTPLWVLLLALLALLARRNLASHGLDRRCGQRQAFGLLAIGAMLKASNNIRTGKKCRSASWLSCDSPSGTDKCEWLGCPLHRQLNSGGQLPS